MLILVFLDKICNSVICVKIEDSMVFGVGLILLCIIMYNINY